MLSGIRHFRAEIAVLITDNPAAFAIERAEKHGIEYLVIKPGDYGSKGFLYQDSL
jgi:phosphoribosylglycinamide formyltransferase-1